MRLFIDTSDNKKTIVSLGGKVLASTSGINRAQEVVKLLDQLVLESAKIEEISEVEVVTGPGSFTGLRVGTAVANAVGFVLGVTVNGKNVLKDGPVEPKYW